MEVLMFILVLLVSYMSMEFVAWFAHKYVMHGFGWFLHADHHSRNPEQSDAFFEKNDSFFVIFAVPAMLGYIFGSVYAMPLLIAAAIGITLYGATYFMIHDVLFHQRIRIRIRGNVYFRALRRAHGMHHVHYSKEEGECFGLLVFPMKYLKMELKKSYMPLYLLINILTISIPLLLSFDKRVHFHTHWRYFFPAMILTLAVFIIWDVIFTSQGVWGFNERYHAELTLLGLPLEEYLFFITVPYASVFAIYVMAEYFPRIRLKDRQVLGVTIVLVVFLLVLAAININQAYTAVNFIFSALLIGWVYFTQKKLLSQFYLSYLVILVPFGLVNGILTGSFIEEQVVWYNDQENLGIRLGTIPFEDIFYGMSLVLMNYYLAETFRKMAERRKIKAV